MLIINASAHAVDSGFAQQDHCLWSASSVLDPSSSHSKILPIPADYLLPDCSAWVSHQAIDIQFTLPQQVLSCAVLNGGFFTTQRYVNLKVGPDCIVGSQTPEQVFHQYVQQCHVELSANKIVGMMTAASMRSCRIVSMPLVGQEKLSVMVTSGMGNLRAAGDRAEYQKLYSEIHNNMPKHLGTINIFIASSVCLSQAALAEALIIATEAKVLALANLGLTSPVSGNLATGTGTDAVALACEIQKDIEMPQVDFVGKHTVFGERLAQAVLLAVTDSIASKGDSP